MDYTKIYRELYSIISQLELSHEKTHKAALRISNALGDIWIYTNVQFPEIADDVFSVVKDFCDETGLVKLTKEQKLERIKEFIDNKESIS